MTWIVGRPVHIDDVPVGQYIQVDLRLSQSPAAIWRVLSKDTTSSRRTRINMRLASLNGLDPADRVAIGTEMPWIIYDRCYLVPDFESDDDPNGWS